MSRFIKRNQMVYDFTKTPLHVPQLPAGFWFVSWSPDVSEAHGDVLWRSFKNDSDGQVFKTFQQYNHCVHLVQLVAQNDRFLPETALLIAAGDPNGLFEYMATIQGLKLSDEVGTIQNVGVLPDYRQRGLATILVRQALAGFQQSGVQKVTLEVTSDNYPAQRLYDNIGFKVFNVYFREFFD